ncbi:MAG: hypothetical protein E7311_07010 [Clostridiales bacterium]|nr:hypothetical protein [Clostridiales bacterium]
MKGIRRGLIVMEVLIMFLGIMLLVSSKSFYDVLINFFQNEKGSLIELFKNSAGVLLSLCLGLIFIWTMITIAIKGEKKHLDKKDKKALIGFFFKINGIPIIMIIFSIIFFEECFILSNICLLIIALYSSAIVLASMFLCGAVFKFIFKDIKGIE